MTQFYFDSEQGILKCHFTGRMDTITCSSEDSLVQTQVAEASKSLTAEGNPQGALKVIFDLQGVDYIASAFIRICLTVAKALEKGNFSIVNTNPQIKKVFIIAGLDENLNVS